MRSTNNEQEILTESLNNIKAYMYRLVAHRTLLVCVKSDLTCVEISYSPKKAISISATDKAIDEMWPYHAVTR